MSEVWIPLQPGSVSSDGFYGHFGMSQGAMNQAGVRIVGTSSPPSAGADISLHRQSKASRRYPVIEASIVELESLKDEYVSGEIFSTVFGDMYAFRTERDVLKIHGALSENGTKDFLAKDQTIEEKEIENLENEDILRINDRMRAGWRNRTLTNGYSATTVQIPQIKGIQQLKEYRY